MLANVNVYLNNVLVDQTDLEVIDLYTPGTQAEQQLNDLKGVGNWDRIEIVRAL